MSSRGKSIIKKSKSISLNGLEPYKVGKHNFENPVVCVEVKAEKRTSVCITCPMYVDEPIESLQVIDKRIPKLSNKMCDECGCTLSYKLRQSLKVCNKWQETL